MAILVINSEAVANALHQVPSMRVDNPALGIIQRRLCITGEELRGVFEPILNEISKLVRDQITACQRPVKAVLMAGGFGSNDYLYATLRQEVQKHNMQVIRPQDRYVASNDFSASSMLTAESETSIIRGGLLKGLATTSSSFAKVHVTGRSARKHYGVEVEVPYDSKEHDSARKYVSAPETGFALELMNTYQQILGFLRRLSSCLDHGLVR